MVASIPFPALILELATNTLHSHRRDEVFPLQTVDVILHDPEEP
jgi:hypothetical protein